MKNFILSVATAALLCAPSAQAQNTSSRDIGIVRTPIIQVDQQRSAGMSVSDVITTSLELENNSTFLPSAKAPVTDELGMTHQRYNQYFNDLKVEFSEIIVHFNAQGQLEKLNGSYFKLGNVNTSPSISAETALNGAVEEIGITTPLWEDEEMAQFANYEKPEGELVILADPADDSRFKLTWKYDLFAKGQAIRDWVYVDASNGEIVLRNPILKHADGPGHDGRMKERILGYVPTLAEAKILGYTESASLVAATVDTRYSGNNIITETFNNGGTWTLAHIAASGTQVVTRDADDELPNIINTSTLINDPNNNNNWESTEFTGRGGKDLGEIDAHYGAVESYNYWLTVHGLDSWDNAGGQINSLVHVSDGSGNTNYDNAFWNGAWLSYGNGSSNGNEGNGNFDILTSLDVCAHEYGHAITDNTADLIYQRESGALNEGFSDIWAAAVEHRAKGTGTDTNPNDEVWLIGDEIDRRSGSVALRSMSNPNEKGQPDTVRGNLWYPATVADGCNSPNNTNDNCGVHFNSGVLNYWFYLLVEGGSGTNDNGDGYSVNAIGMNKAELIAFRTLNVYLTNSSDFAATRPAAISAATDLYGACSPETRAVVDAWHAVGVGNAATTTYASGSWSNGTPSATDGTHAVINANFTVPASNFNACSCEINSGRTVTVPADRYMNVASNLTVNGTLNVAHQGSVVQTEDDASVTNNGSINVNVTTPSLEGRDFMLMGSPMTGETGNDVFNSAYRVRQHFTNQFELNASVTATFGAAINFADENTSTTSNWGPDYSGALNPGEGYFVRPQVNGASANTYSYVHNTGTLNTGDITYNTVIGPDGAGNGSPNVVANPYPSAISATQFMADNGLSAIYFWEHNTQPSNAFPGQYTTNFTMEDISNINAAGVGNPAASGGATPTNVLASMQGFAFKAPDADNITFSNSQRVTNDNNTLRDFEELANRDIARLNVMSEAYERGSTTTIAFLEQGSVGFDEGLDNSRLANVVSIYTHLEDGSNAFGIQTRELFTENVKISVGFSTLIDETTSYRISVSDLLGLNLTQATPYLIDNYKNTITNLLEEDYIFESEKGRFDARFTLQFKSENILNTSEVTVDDISIYPNPTDGTLNIASKSLITNVVIYDLQGREVTNISVDNERTYQVDLSELVASIYFVKVTTEEGNLTKRIIRR